MSENQLIGIIYSQLIEEFGFDYEKDLWMIAENIAGKIASQPAQLNDNQKIVLEFLKSKVPEDTVNPINAIFILGTLWKFRRYASLEERRTVNAYCELDSRQQAQVIEAFSEWALEQEEG